MKSLFATVAVSAAALAQAHSGHGAATAAHWHATDAWGLLLIAAVIGVALWMRRGQ
jgi:hypothetical protein